MYKHKLLTIIMILGLGIFLVSCTNAVEFTVYFDTNGGSEVEPVMSDGASVVSVPEDPVKAGYNFDGWYWDNETFQTQFTANSLLDAPISSNMTVYAKWTPLSFDITYILNGGTNEASNPTTFNTDTTSLVIQNPTKEGYTFGGWYSDAEFTTAYSFTTIPVEDITVYAKWSINSYTLQFVDIDDTVIQTADYTYQADLGTVILPEVSKTGYSFTGWNHNLPEAMPAYNITMKAEYSINQYTINFDSNGDSEVSSITKNYHSEVIKPTNPTKEGYKFIGCYQDETLTEPFRFLIMPESDSTAYAAWEIIEYTLSFQIVNQEAVNHLEIGTLSDDEIITFVSVGTYNSVVVTNKNRVFIWGSNGDGQLGNNTRIDASIPLEITARFELYDNEDIIEVNTGASHSLALTSLGRVFAWGDNVYGMLGTGDYYDHLKPYEITDKFNLDGEDYISHTYITDAHSYAISNQGRVFSWGYNVDGIIGDGSFSFKNLPIDITNRFYLNLDEVIIEIAAGYHHTLAISNQGRVFSWGNNEFNQLGDTTTHNRNEPIEITDQFNLSAGEMVIKIAAGAYSSLCITNLGNLFAWGPNGYGLQADDGTLFGSLPFHSQFPLRATGTFNLNENEMITQIYTGYDYSFVSTNQGRIFSWGDNDYGQLGIGSSIFIRYPTEISANFNLNDGEFVSKIASGREHSLAITNENRIFSWGRNLFGVLGDGTTTTKRTLPTEITFLNYLENYAEQVHYYSESIDQLNPEIEGYVFDGWYIDMALSIPYIFEGMPSNDLILYGKWVEVIGLT